MKLLSLLISICALGLTWSCRDSKPPLGKTISVDLSKDSLESASIVNLIALETTDESLFSEIKRIEVLDERILILDQFKRKNIFLFNSSGAFLKRLATGKGVGEIVHPYDFDFNRASNRIVVFDGALMRISEFDLDLNHLSSSSFDSRYVRSFRQQDDMNWLVHYQTNEKLTDVIYSYIVYSPDFKTSIDTLLPDRLDKKSMILSNSISRENSEVLFCRPYDQNIYTYRDGILDVKYSIKFDRYNLSSEIREKDEEDLLQSIRTGEVINMVGDIINTDRYFACTFSLARKRFYIIYDKTQDNVKITAASNILPFGYLKGASNNDEFYLIVEPEAYHSFLKKADSYPSAIPLGSSIADSNPLLVVFTIP